MIKLRRIDIDRASLYPVELDDLRVIENKIYSTQCIRRVRKEIDDELVNRAIEELGYRDENLKIKKIKKLIKKILANKIQEI